MIVTFFFTATATTEIYTYLHTLPYTTLFRSLSDGTFTSSARNCTCAARAAVRRSRMMVSKSVIAIWSSLEKVGVEVLEEVEEHAGGRLGVLRQIGRASCRDRVCQYV